MEDDDWDASQEKAPAPHARRGPLPHPDAAPFLEEVRAAPAKRREKKRSEAVSG